MLYYLVIANSLTLPYYILIAFDLENPFSISHLFFSYSYLKTWSLHLYIQKPD